MHSHDHGHEDPSDASSTGFLPISLAIGLFVVGLFALGYVRCEPTWPNARGLGQGEGAGPHF